LTQYNHFNLSLHAFACFCPFFPSCLSVDGRVLAGWSAVDESLVTGESRPRTKRPGDAVIGSTMNMNAPLLLVAESVGDATVLAQIVRQVSAAQQQKAPIQAFADRVAAAFVPTVLLLASITTLTWIALQYFDVVPEEWRPAGVGQFLFALLFGLSVLVISCPCALGLATPTAVMVATGLAASFGILFKGGEALERSGCSTHVLFDKTGTLTEGRLEVSALLTDAEAVEQLNSRGAVAASSSSSSPAPLPLSLPRLDTNMLWALIGCAEKDSDHILGKALHAHAKKLLGIGAARSSSSKGGHALSVSDADLRAILLSAPSSVVQQTGAGIAASVGARRIVIGNHRWLQAHRILPAAEATKTSHSKRKSPSSISASSSSRFLSKIADLERNGRTVVLVAVDGVLVAAAALLDRVRAESPLVISTLQSLGMWCHAAHWP
jgi:Cu+-exporting ATPase